MRTDLHYISLTLITSRDVHYFDRDDVIAELDVTRTPDFKIEIQDDGPRVEGRLECHDVRQGRRQVGQVEVGERDAVIARKIAEIFCHFFVN